MAQQAMRQLVLAVRLSAATSLRAPTTSVLQQTLKLQSAAFGSNAGMGEGSCWPGSRAAAGFAATSMLGFAAAMIYTPSQAEVEKQEEPSIDPYARPTKLKGIPHDITLYQYEVCPFCCKVKAVLDFYKVPYKVIEVNPLTKSELKWSSYKKVPVVQLDEEVVVDSTIIVSRLAAEVEAAAGKAVKSSKLKSQGVNLEDETKWRKWVDEKFVKLMTANIYRSWEESWNSFTYITEKTNWSWGTRELARMSGALIMWQVGKKMPAKYGIEGDLREALYVAADEFIEAVGPNRDFLGGDQPNLADLAVFGVLRAIEKAPTFSDLMANSKIAGWYAKVEAVAGSSARTSTEGSQWRIENTRA